jgi:anion-transporting  ArsA/GET3 family ATPase
MEALVHLGPGGVGKTTVAAATAMAGALDGARVAVLTVDPARRLADTLGLKPGGDEARLVDGPWTGQLWAAQLDPAATLTAVLRRHGRAGQAERIMANPTFQAITHATPGINEYMAVERLHQLCQDDRFDRVIVDTPPSRHGIEFLDSPRRLVRFVDNRLYRQILAPRAGMLRSVNAAAQLGLRMTAKLVGMELVDNVIRLFADLEGLDEGFRARADEMHRLLTGPLCRYRLVTTARPEPMAETTWIHHRLVERGLMVDAVVVNRLLPAGLTQPANVGRGPGRAALRSNLEELSLLACNEQALLAGAATELGPMTVIGLQEQPRPLRGRDELLALAAQLTGGREPPATRRRRPARPRPLRSTR